MINPVNLGNTQEKIAIYKVEPYVVAADVYSISLHSGRGGWTWYTGSAGWMYRFIVESLFGIIREADTLRFEPCIPKEWDSFSVNYKYQETFYRIKFLQTLAAEESKKLKLDGVELPGNVIALVDDHLEHCLEVSIAITKQEVTIERGHLIN